METSLGIGDEILVSKIEYDPGLPQLQLEILWLNLFFYLNKEARADMGSNRLEYSRLN